MKLKNISLSMMAISSGLLIAGCQTADPKATKTGSGVETISIKSGQKFGYTFYKVNPDCSSAKVPTLKLISKPSHGTIVISQGYGHSAYAAGHPLSKCNSHRILMASVIYKAASGFVGTDTVTISGQVAGNDSYDYVTLRFNISK
ncbi:hypothetical protein [Candidatus Phyllobacterium onerii]|uniref:hypothetical protein n=1 Tax=Candidatus Phyllobacterium onerii TaxID=3020828 RepID=UPI00232B2FA0|nr:hypothetical protein [Phyllobacterium sp. IY22]